MKTMGRRKHQRVVSLPVHTGEPALQGILISVPQATNEAETLGLLVLAASSCCMVRSGLVFRISPSPVMMKDFRKCEILGIGVFSIV